MTICHRCLRHTETDQLDDQHRPICAAYANGRAPALGDQVISAHGTHHGLAVLDAFTNEVGWLSYFASVGTVTDLLPDGTIVVFREEVGFHDPVGHRYACAAKHLLVLGDS